MLWSFATIFMYREIGEMVTHKFIDYEIGEWNIGICSRLSYQVDLRL